MNDLMQEQPAGRSHLGLMLGGAGALALGGLGVRHALKARAGGKLLQGTAEKLVPKPMKALEAVSKSTMPTVTVNPALMNAGKDVATKAVNPKALRPVTDYAKATPTLDGAQLSQAIVGHMNPELRGALQNSDLVRHGVPEHMAWQLAELSRGKQPLKAFLSEHGAKMASQHMYVAFFDELEKNAGLGDTIKRLALTGIPGTKPWFVQPAQQIAANTARKSTGVGRVLTTGASRASRAAGNGVYDVSSLAKSMGV